MEGSSAYQGDFSEMAEKNDERTVRKRRADAERNRLLLMETAKTVFADKGSSASLEEIARIAGVGIGTLYRHFPTRDALVSAIYRNETAQLAAAAKSLAETHLPVEALRLWLVQFVDYVVTKHGMSEVLDSLVGGTSELYADSADLIIGAVNLLVDRAVATGEIRLAMDPLDILRALAGGASISSGLAWRDAARQLIDILIVGMRASR
ncbi:TetR/AcrR family transcriptional regulator [Rhizobium laguerreae]|uniref:TetR/AcrR family transcriptional regulator n=1 Tax=Rhizobium laguerreae TaxID=1076926 RepID=UPI001C91B729|nr:TetR/AcrR family transcriptional regulator [Rhizobium laguerreae]MBY3120838.1 TetR/AcrR family transcriptional regulator [Rhizobium laguerreae]MBY3187496.1 TetR/AcrR family transcriptional regulator [Rhizobium laguerreae]MBY3198295.1 TetR/AcrR family transcriptional regulator [Rhizobium laguerreae]MBY3208260.1 TetR/AcrR family transcriptional regulator [Rhizobium laguerreae]MBY3227244.1 TetR/AcrR family transcriptional regulator [Rhizobium laguerreae]